jgi:hypothetical protein
MNYNYHIETLPHGQYGNRQFPRIPDFAAKFTKEPGRFMNVPVKNKEWNRRFLGFFALRYRENSLKSASAFLIFRPCLFFPDKL